MIIFDAERGRNIELSLEQTAEAFRMAARAAGDGYLSDADAEHLVIIAAREMEQRR